ncbi:hypothetical protein [Yersinia pekkanenii]|uniref:Uncharacterized protein n=1 Tax=Yersinia pekkanenii TaxID=1288385 RepID=A0A0T9RF79_9GAMM|nr:hypothetical protein [Yersinia pekkanenii]CNI59880.1 Uncharacterised protein [Yersinia pekkanenii]CRY69470.1 Uncharacterised protein [Yersinia pekkanenii]
MPDFELKVFQADAAKTIIDRYAFFAGHPYRPGNGGLINPIITTFFDVEPLFLSQMFSLHAKGSPVGPER